MSDPTRRLRRPLPGSRLPDAEGSLARLFAREEPPARNELVPARDQAELRMTVRRDTRHVASCSPNAPLLIRIVRYPFRLDASRAARRKYIEQPEKFERLNAAAEVNAALADRVRMRFTSGSRRRPKPFAVRPSTWTLLPPAPGDDS